MLATNPTPAPTPSSLLWTRHSPTIQEALLGSVTDGVLFTLQHCPGSDWYWAWRLTVEACDGPNQKRWFVDDLVVDVFLNGHFLSEAAAKIEAQAWADLFWRTRHEPAESGGVRQAATAEGTR